MTYEQWTHDQDHETYSEYLDAFDDAVEFDGVYGREFPEMVAQGDAE